jgi:hypothetical protein
MDQVRVAPHAIPISTAERLDRAVDRLLSGAAPGLDGELRPLMRTGSALAAALRPVPAGERYAAELWSRLARPAPSHRITAALAGLASRRPPSWLLVTGAVSSAAVGVGVTAFALWRGSRRPAARGFHIGQR